MSESHSIKDTVQRYLEERRSLGFQMRGQGAELMRFARYADARNHSGPLTVDLMLGWAREHVKHTSELTGPRRLETVRLFAEYCRQFDLATEIPPRSILGRGHRRLVPHIFTDQEVVHILEAANSVTPKNSLRALTYRTLFGLMAAAGLRLSEALNLTVGDVDLDAGAIAVRQTKFKKSRCLPLHASVVQALAQYRQSRDRYCASGQGMPFFASAIGRHLSKRTVERVFQRLLLCAGIQSRSDYPSPRIYDLRHTFAVRRLQRWREQGQPIDQAVFWLCTYLGHVNISNTYWYITGVPELMELVGDRFENFVSAGEAR